MALPQEHANSRITAPGPRAFATQSLTHSPSPRPPAAFNFDTDMDPETTLLPDIEYFTVQSKDYDVIAEGEKSNQESVYGLVKKTSTSAAAPGREEGTRIGKHKKSVSFAEREEDEMDVTVVEEVEEANSKGAETTPVSEIPQRNAATLPEERTGRRRLTLSVHHSSH